VTSERRSCSAQTDHFWKDADPDIPILKSSKGGVRGAEVAASELIDMPRPPP
jgi:hypothetical protein